MIKQEIDFLAGDTTNTDENTERKKKKKKHKHIKVEVEENRFLRLFSLIVLQCLFISAPCPKQNQSTQKHIRERSINTNGKSQGLF
jgi:hypothetical protein